MKSGTLSPEPSEEQQLLNSVRALARALEAAIPHLSPDALREVSSALAAEVRLLPSGTAPSVLRSVSIEDELRAVWSSLGRTRA